MMFRTRAAALISAAILGVVVVATTFAAPAALHTLATSANARQEAPQAQAAVTGTAATGLDPESQIMEAVYQKVSPSVVQVVNLTQGGRRAGSTAVPQAEGSGIVWDTLGHIVTNDHVVSGASQLQVVFADGTQADATLVGTDPSSDLAVVKVDPAAASNLVPIRLGDMAQVKVGELAIAIGNPFGFQSSMTRGIVSALGRTIPSQTNFSIPEAIQTDAAV